jgi:NADH-quinone oxidoreductase subunit A
MGQYLPIVALMVLAVIFGAVSLLVSKLLSPRRSTRAKRGPYESGIVPTRDVPRRFPVHFYLVAMIFIVFDIEIIFLYPWAVIYRDLGAFGLVAVAIFTVPIVVGLLYEIASGTFGWGDVRRRRMAVAPVGPTPEDVARDEEMVSAARTGMTTVRRVGPYGRQPPASSEEVTTPT